MKRFNLLITAFVLLFTLSIQITFAASYSDLTSYQKQKYWDMWTTECQSLLISKQYTDYRTCALNVMEKASQLVEEKEAWCTDSDGGADFLQKGIVKTDLYPNGIEDYIYTFDDGSEYLFEGACSDDNHYFYYQQNCKELGEKYVADVAAGACVLTNAAPVIEPIGDKTTQTGDELKFTIKASDSDGDSIAFSAEGLPTDAKFDNGTFTWTPTANQAGEYKISFKASDGYETSQQTITVTISKKPTEFCGIVSENKVLTKEQSPYVVKCHILVEKNITLTIEPGVEIRFDGLYYLRVDGTLKADGAKDQMILFTSNKKDPKPGDWNKIKFEDSSVDWDGINGSIIRYAKMEYGGYYVDWPDVGVIRTYSASPLIENNEISNYLRYGIQTMSLSSAPIIKNNILKDGIANGDGFAIYIEGSSNISNNQIINNNLGGGQIKGIVYAVPSGSPLIEENYIFNNSGIGIVGGNGYGNGSNLASPIIKNNNILNNVGGGLWIVSGGKVINNVISNNGKIGIGLYASGDKNIDLIDNFISGSNQGIYIQNSIANIKNNTIANNDLGIYIFSHFGGPSKVNISYNNIYSNPEYAVYMKKPALGPAFDVNAQNNWWGTTDEATVKTMIYDFYDDFDLGKVIYQPFAEKKF